MCYKLLITICLLCGPVLSKAQECFVKEKHALIQTERADGRYLSSYAIVHGLLKNTKPQYAYQEGMNKDEFKIWQEGVRYAMSEVMKFPIIQGQPSPKRISVHKRDGYTLEKWEFYPFEHAVSTFLVLKPDNLDKAAPGILCIPGSGRTKEGLVGEPGVSDKFTEDYTNPKVAMALNYVRSGYVAVAVDNAAAGESSDLEKYYWGSNYDYNLVSRILLEMGWSWLGYTSYLDNLVLEWMRTQSYIRKDRIVISGFSLGTEPLMVLGVLNKDVYAFVYNDFLCQTKERAEVMTMPTEKGRRPFPNSIRHLIPGYWKYFNFPDVVASLAPRHIILTEGGLDRDFNKIKSAYRLLGKPDNVICYHYPKFAKKEARQNLDNLPYGIDSDSFFRLANVDPPAHCFKYEIVLPWLKKILNE